MRGYEPGSASGESHFRDFADDKTEPHRSPKSTTSSASTLTARSALWKVSVVVGGDGLEPTASSV